MKIKDTFVFLILALSGLFFYPTCASSTDLYFIDAHSQVDEDIDQDEIIRRMAEAGIQKTILSSRKRRRAFDVTDWAKSHPDKIIASIRVKGKHYTRNTGKFYKKINKQLRSGRFNAISEVILYHAQKGERASEVIIYPDDERVTAVLEAAGEQSWPLVIHIEFAAADGDMRKDFYTKMETLISENPEQAFCLIHMGQLNAKAVSKLIKRHKNIYFITSHSNPLAVQRSNQPWVNMFAGKELAPDWKLLIIQGPALSRQTY